jgi:hypothetical protein
MKGASRTLGEGGLATHRGPTAPNPNPKGGRRRTEVEEAAALGGPTSSPHPLYKERQRLSLIHLLGFFLLSLSLPDVGVPELGTCIRGDLYTICTPSCC